MCCFLTALVFFGPRLAILVWWLVQPARFALAFPDGFLLPLLGFIFLPWTLIMYLLVYTGGIVGFDWIILALGLFADLSGYFGSYRNKHVVGA
ncbi:MAG: hypothetical protein GWP61_10260 [Chloroflexi bacterium]|jgi:hypothetical protein|nr:hypothetical protein [Chloroflexota bacterium]